MDILGDWVLLIGNAWEVLGDTLAEYRKVYS